MSDKRTLHDEALALLAMPQLGTYLTPDQRELVLRALEEPETLAREVKRLQEVAAESQRLFGVKVARVSVVFEPSGGIHVIATCPGGDERALGELVADKISSLLGTDEEDSLAPAPKEAAASSEPPAAPPPTTQVARDVLFTPAERPNEEKHGERVQSGVDGAAQSPQQGERQQHAGLPAGGVPDSADGDVRQDDPGESGVVRTDGQAGAGDERVTPPEEPRCAGHNRSANVPCNTSRVFVQRDGKWFCRRHDPARGERLAAEEGAA